MFLLQYKIMFSIILSDDQNIFGVMLDCIYKIDTKLRIQEDVWNHSHKKQKNSLEIRADPGVFSL